ncbi:hypothetical protein N7492_001317 [Penicillium capsulatum]|uniref:Aminoglycoside phosphotransferase domain-containing protein n=1 Tax=Penicillium capsulatum TaxID=69766 RepID=A0A9W9LZA6_9EURO|nr:hypothetical protein N7492_001317 [Penicillium capsulatum]
MLPGRRVLQILDREVQRPIGNFMIRHHKPYSPVAFDVLRKGAFNISFQMMYEKCSAVIRFPLPGATMFPEEKMQHEVATMRYLHDQTSVPLPFVFHWGPKKENPLELGPFIIMDYIDHEKTMYHTLNTPGIPGSERGRLNPEIDEDKLEDLYGQLAEILLQLSKPSLPKIGSLSQVDDFTWEVDSRPLSMPLNELVRLGSLPQSKLPARDTTFDTASAYFEFLAELHMAHLSTQRNDSVDSGDDCRRKYIARCLFRKLARDHKLTGRRGPLSPDHGSFKLWCDDFRPANVLVDEESKITGVMDWEFTYAAPVELSHAPPWLLLLEKPEYWPDGLDAWCVQYERRLPAFLKALTRREDDAIHQGWLQESQRLSGPMRESWDAGDFWIAYAARCNFAFDAIYWQKLDRRFFGPTETSDYDVAGKERVDLLDDKEKAEMEALVVRKLEEMPPRVLAWEPDEYTLEHFDIKEKHAAKQASIDEAEVNAVSDQLSESAT